MQTGPLIERDLVAGLERGLGERVAHFAGGAIADEAHRVDRLARGAGGDEEFSCFSDSATPPRAR